MLSLTDSAKDSLERDGLCCIESTSFETTVGDEVGVHRDGKSIAAKVVGQHASDDRRTMLVVVSTISA